MNNATRWLAVLGCGWMMCSLGASAADPVAGAAAPPEAPVPERIEFNRDVRPILADNCFACHGPDSEQRQADLRLDLRQAAIDARVIVPGNLDDSGLIDRIEADNPELLMPPATSHKKLDQHQREILRRWIQQGAEYQVHWSYQAPVKATIPDGVHPIDYFISAKLQSINLAISPPADRRTLARRLHFDLIGLPPTASVVTSFVNDPNPNAYKELVETLLASPHYGERMALGWLDVVRYADTIGYHSDTPRNVWPYRDWVIDSFNRNKPFDRFTQEQIAGDLLPDASDETRIGSAFNRLLLSTEEGGAQPKDYEARMLTDRVRAIGTAWLGQTTGCAQCHDHKFDPFTMQDFYSLGAFFADIDEEAIGRREDGMIVCPDAQRPQWQRLQAALAQAQKQLQATQREVESNDQNQNSQLAIAQDQFKRAQSKLKEFEASLPHCLVSRSRAKPRIVRLLPRGNWMDESGPEMKPALPGYLLPSPAEPPASSRELTRLDLANWLVARDNPLTARTVMNRLWKQLFGTGLSRVLEDLGAQGEPPSHPELLDWLACEFMDSGWDFKHMVRTIVSSSTYQQTSTANAQLRALDPTNRWWARQNAYRLDAELVRDNALFVSSLLVPNLGGPSIKPYQPDAYWENLNFPTRDYVADTGPAQYRRGLYIWWQRSFLHPSLLAFDAPSREECVAERNRSNLPQQALVLLNDPTYIEAARALAARVLRESGPVDQQRVEWAWQIVIQRQPSPSELETALNLVARHRQAYHESPAQVTRMLDVGLTQPPEGLDPSELAAWTHLGRVLLNLHETITRS